LPGAKYFPPLRSWHKYSLLLSLLTYVSLGFMITFASCLIISEALGWRAFPNVGPDLGTTSSLGPLILGMPPHWGLYPTFFLPFFHHLGLLLNIYVHVFTNMIPHLPFIYNKICTSTYM